MVSNTIRFILQDEQIDPATVVRVFGGDENEYWCYLTELNAALREAEKEYDPIQVQREVREWVETIPDRNQIRITAIKEQLQDAKFNPEKHNVQKLLTEFKILTGKINQTTPEMIARAKEYPLEKILQTPVRRNTALCPFHNEKTPSFSIRKDNTFNCYGCGKHGDSIDLYRFIHNTDFRTAVNALQ